MATCTWKSSNTDFGSVFAGVFYAAATALAIGFIFQAAMKELPLRTQSALEERLAEGHDISDEERALMARALEENAVIVAQMTPFFEE